MDLNLKIKLPLLTIISKLKIDVKSNNSPLIAHTVLTRTLQFIIKFIDDQTDDETRRVILNKGEIFENLYKIAVGDITLTNVNYDVLGNDLMDNNVKSNNRNMNIFNVIFNNIVQKGIGDIFQEINSVCKYGGYTMDNYKTGDNVLSLNTTTGDQVRIFIANDRPSVSRFVFILCNGPKNQINVKAFGGTASKSELTIFTQNKNSVPVCEPEEIILRKGGYKRKTLKKNKCSRLYSGIASQ
jgi:hypothetical protein